MTLFLAAQKLTLKEKGKFSLHLCPSGKLLICEERPNLVFL